MSKRIAISILVLITILAVGCGKGGDSFKEEDGVAQDRVFVKFTVPYRDIQVSDLLDTLGSHVIQTVYYSDRVQVSVPEGKTAGEMIEVLEESDLVEDADPYYLYAPGEVTVKFNVAHDDERATALLESLGSQLERTYEHCDFVTVSVPKDKTVAEMVEALSGSPLVDYAEPNYCAYI